MQPSSSSSSSVCRRLLRLLRRLRRLRPQLAGRPAWRCRAASRRLRPRAPPAPAPCGAPLTAPGSGAPALGSPGFIKKKNRVPGPFCSFPDVSNLSNTAPTTARRTLAATSNASHAAPCRPALPPRTGACQRCWSRSASLGEAQRSRLAPRHGEHGARHAGLRWITDRQESGRRSARVGRRRTQPVQPSAGSDRPPTSRLRICRQAVWRHLRPSHGGRYHSRRPGGARSSLASSQPISADTRSLQPRPRGPLVLTRTRSFRCRRSRPSSWPS